MTIHMRLLAVALLLLSLNACTTVYRAEYIVDTATIAVELFPAHPILAEYDRALVLSSKGKEIARQTLFPDTGGYSSSNLYQCSSTQYMLKGYFDSWIVDLREGTLTEAECSDSKPIYVGTFVGAGDEPWRFYSASERHEVKLEIRFE